MHRHVRTPRPDWQARVESTGLLYHSHESGPYWDESACYELTAAEVDVLEQSARTLHYLCIDAAEAVIQRNWWHRLSIPQAAIPAILRSWERDDFSLYGRFDVAFDGVTPPKLLEYNADTPTALVEAAITQWFWLQDVFPHEDQFNSLHERLIEAWRRWSGTPVHFCALQEQLEDLQTVLYLRDTAQQAGVITHAVEIEDIGWHTTRREFVDHDGGLITRAFKLYPWEWMWQEPFGQHLPGDRTVFIEPAWKMLLSNKGLLPILWELYPEHPNLLPAFDDPSPLAGRYVQKPKLSREGANVRWIENHQVVEENGGLYGGEGCIYQSIAEPVNFDGQHPVFGLWIVDHEPAGVGIREDQRRITGNLSRFVPHFFRP